MLRQHNLHPELTDLVRRCGGVETRFAELPFACRCALAHFFGENGRWPYPEHLKPLEKLRESWLRAFRRHVRKYLTDERADYRVGHAHIPLKDLAEHMVFFEEAYEDYFHVLEESDYIPNYPPQDIKRRWPVILSTEQDALPLLDGWHRFSRYWQLGNAKTPAIYLIQQ